MKYGKCQFCFEIGPLEGFRTVSGRRLWLCSVDLKDFNLFTVRRVMPQYATS